MNDGHVIYVIKVLPVVLTIILSLSDSCVLKVWWFESSKVQNKFTDDLSLLRFSISGMTSVDGF